MPEDCNGRHLKLWTPATYRIEVVGALDESWSDRLMGDDYQNTPKSGSIDGDNADRPVEGSGRAGGSPQQSL